MQRLKVQSPKFQVPDPKEQPKKIQWLFSCHAHKFKECKNIYMENFMCGAWDFGLGAWGLGLFSCRY
jgi:hypothetical protein